MLTAMLCQVKVFSTDPKWDGRKEELRASCKDRETCPICHEPVVCKFGHEKIHHFAHTKGADCPGSKDSLEHMIGKTLLYGFLQQRIGTKAQVELECFFQDAGFMADVVAKYPNGQLWAMEFFCGHLKRREIEERIDYYLERGIPVTWVLSAELYEELPDYEAFKLKRAEVLLLKDSGIDKYYENDWYVQILMNRKHGHLPRDGGTRGSLYYLCTKDMVLTIHRAIEETTHLRLYRSRKTLSGQLIDANISNKGGALYFKEELIWAERYKDAQSVLQEISAHAEAERARAKVLTPKTSAGTIRPISPGWGSSITTPVPEREPAQRQELLFTCEICGLVLPERGMAIYTREGMIGKCKDCMR